MFNLIYAYYCGALVMYQSSSSGVPFTSMREGILLYPDWKMVFSAGYEGFFFDLAVGGDEIMDSYWNVLQSAEGKDLMKHSNKEGMRQLSEEGFFYYTADLRRDLYAETTMEVQNLELRILSHEGTIQTGLMFPKYSPVTKMFNEGKVLKE